jgi:hypothetical protein
MGEEQESQAQAPAQETEEPKSELTHCRWVVAKEGWA